MTTREMSRDTKYMISVMQAYEDGKEIEYRRKTEAIWVSCEPLWDWVRFDYRIKPEEKCVPYDSVLELEKDKWLKNKGSKNLYRISGLDPRDNTVRMLNAWYSLKELFELYTYEDDTFCGKKVSE